MGFAGYVYPCLVLTYLGQAAMLMERPQVVENTYWASIPRWAAASASASASRPCLILLPDPCLLYNSVDGQAGSSLPGPALPPRPIFYPMLVLATLASVVASQALITASYSIIANVGLM
jgi:KUP system potassium uptake protein